MKIAIATGLGIAAAALIVIFFSPSWVSLVAWHEMPQQFADLVAVRRGVAVIQQVEEPFARIKDPMHSIVRWRLLFPLVGHFLRLPPGVVLLLSPIGCILVLSLLIGFAHERGIPWLECFLLAVVVGAASWFFVATGWLGYFDSWLVLGLLTVGFARPRSMVLLACLLTPWVDERFVIGFPLAMLVRCLGDPQARTSFDKVAHGFMREGIGPTLLILAVATIRLTLIGRGGSDDAAAYTQRVAFFHLSATRLVFGAWEGLRVGWVLVAAAVLVLARRGDLIVAMLLLFAVVATTVLGLATANDLSRSATLVLPVIPLGWVLARSTDGWNRWRTAWVLAVAALALPAHHVVSDFTLRVQPLSEELRLLESSGLIANPWP